ncbi:MAG: hypothetical protein OHK0046_25640 [Anaerolineae bacterium]
MAHKGYNPTPPDLAVEVISDPTNAQERAQLRRKIMAYLAAGVVVWVVDAEARTVEIYQTGEAPVVLSDTETIDGGDILPGFILPLSEIFPTV